jgi:hypothetical protein
MTELRMTDPELREIYRKVRTIAVVGASGNPGKPAYAIPAYLQSQGYRIIPVNPRGGELYGQRVYPSAPEIPEPVDLVDVFRPPAEAEAVVRDTAELAAAIIWFQPGTHTPEAVRQARNAGLTVVTGLCLGATHGRLGLGPGPERPGRAT